MPCAIKDIILKIEYEDYTEKIGENETLRIRKIKTEPSFSPTKFIPSSSSTTSATSVGTTRCTSCNIDFKNVALAMMHQSCHGNGGKFVCSQCGDVLSNVFDFWGHIYSRNCV